MPTKSFEDDMETEFVEYEVEEEYEEEIIYEEVIEDDEIFYEEIIEEIIEEEDEELEMETQLEPVLEKTPKERGHRSVKFGASVSFEDTATTSQITPTNTASSISSDWLSEEPTAYQLAMDGNYDRLKEILLRCKKQLDDWYCEDVATIEAIISDYVNATDEHGRSALFYACNQNSMSMTMLLLSPPFRANPNALDNNGFPPIYVPCQRGNIFIVQLLLKFGADANHAVKLDAEDSNKDRSRKKDDPDKFTWWRLEEKSDCDDSTTSKTDNDDDDPHESANLVATPLLAAIFEKRVKTVELLLENGANPNVVTNTGAGKKSAMELATEVVPNHTIEQSLHQHGASIVSSAEPVSSTDLDMSPDELLPEWMKRYDR